MHNLRLNLYLVLFFYADNFIGLFSHKIKMFLFVFLVLVCFPQMVRFPQVLRDSC